MAVSVRVHPSPKCLFDEPVQVRVGGLSPLQQVTMKASLTDEKGQAFHSLVFYRADEQGELDLSDGPFPGIIDLYGGISWLIENRASPLANHGFLTLALGKVGYDDLPKDFTNLDLEYFEEAANFLREYPKVKGPGVGAIGISKGADLVLSMITFLPHVVAAVSIGGCNANTLGNPIDEANKDCVIPIEKAEGHFLFVVGGDDKNWKTSLSAQQAVQQLKENGKENYELIVYSEAGHLLELSYVPFCPASFHRLVGHPVVWGGQMKPHSLAQLDLWPKIQTFLRKYLEQQSKL